jgi:hypothetical protein
MKKYLVNVVSNAEILIVECDEIEVAQNGALFFKKNILESGRFVLETILVFAPGQWISVKSLV